ncbi:hypothetical protein PR202_ga30090 [Eleusine coracana subsp. coracana]|uniref:Phytocyanin domain-containing protein n=1 Tax=Eleusine coracana subsp. coracana TaxID=191504 RepID=A0AAV5DNK3_ELECO|nr:hypothetical protein QOZ80_4AG0323000 [Eleusine coracana subsp. coracana]GJN11858.1 hypothetical protein PR202_ga30090 [Eleusine coracana subsp. coracana]
MAWRSSTGTNKILAAFLFVLVFAQYEEGGGVCKADGRVWPVGDSAGWTFGVMGWPNFKPFMAGDVLLFHYKPGMHNVVQVGSVQYALCQLSGNVTMWSSGNDRVTLASGMSFFISCMPGDCERGMKIAVTAR